MVKTQVDNEAEGLKIMLSGLNEAGQRLIRFQTTNNMHLTFMAFLNSIFSFTIDLFMYIYVCKDSTEETIEI